MLSYCGLDCEKCDAFIATATNDDALRAKVAAEWSAAFHATLAASDIHCTGCTPVGGVKFAHCENTCQVRKCARGRGLSTCAGCADYGCAQLNEIHGMAPHAKAALDALRV